MTRFATINCCKQWPKKYTQHQEFDKQRTRIEHSCFDCLREKEQEDLYKSSSNNVPHCVQSETALNHGAMAVCSVGRFFLFILFHLLCTHTSIGDYTVKFFLFSFVSFWQDQKKKKMAFKHVVLVNVFFFLLGILCITFYIVHSRHIFLGWDFYWAFRRWLTKIFTNEHLRGDSYLIRPSME